MNTFPTLTTPRLVLRPFRLEDAPAVQQLAGAWEIADTTANIPHPYEDGMAEAWISTHQNQYDTGDSLPLAVTLKSSGELIGAIGLHYKPVNYLAELGYWIGVSYWLQGYCTEAGREMVRYAFDVLQFNRVQARHMTRNPASGRVMQKIGMQYEGTLRQSLYRWAKFEDVAMYAILRSDRIPG
jgi:RimJ/RimL family protein N-acetyltransferase